MLRLVCKARDQACSCAAVCTLRAVGRGQENSRTLLTHLYTGCASAIAHRTCMREPRLQPLLHGTPYCYVVSPCPPPPVHMRFSASLTTLPLPSLPRRSNVSRVSLFTYGSPRVGNRAFAHHLRATLKDGWRAACDADPTPK